MGNTRKETKELNTAQDNAATPTRQFQQKQSYMQIKSGIWKNDNPCDWLKPNWPKLQAQKPKPAEKPKQTETDGFSTISVGFGWDFYKPKISVSVGRIKKPTEPNWLQP